MRVVRDFSRTHVLAGLEQRQRGCMQLRPAQGRHRLVHGPPRQLVTERQLSTGGNQHASADALFDAGAVRIPGKAAQHVLVDLPRKDRGAIECAACERAQARGAPQGGLEDVPRGTATSPGRHGYGHPRELPEFDALAAFRGHVRPQRGKARL